MRTTPSFAVVAPRALLVRPRRGFAPSSRFRASGSVRSTDGVSAFVAVAASAAKTQPPVLVVPVGDEDLVCTPAVTPSCSAPSQTPLGAIGWARRAPRSA
jgi:hypothetical protein